MRCAVGCGHLQHGVDVGIGVDIARGDPAHPTSGGLACGRGLRESADPDGEWLTRPLVRRDDELVTGGVDGQFRGILRLLRLQVDRRHGRFWARRPARRDRAYVRRDGVPVPER
jgi:hypothetical protein